MKYYIIILSMILISISSYGQASDSLNHYLEIAARNNPGVKSDFMVYKASLEKIPQAGAYQDPQLEIGFFLKPMHIIGGKQVANFKLMQMFPWFGTRRTARTEASHMAKMSFEKFRETRDNLYLQVYTQWYVLCSLQQQLINSQENKTLLIQLEELAIRKFSSPGSSSSSGYSVPTPITQSKPITRNNTEGGMSGMGSSSVSMQASSSNSGGAMAAMEGGSSGVGMGAGFGMSDVLRVRLEILELDNNIATTLSEIHAQKAKFNALLNRPSDTNVVVPDSFDVIPYLFDTTSAITQIESQNPMLGMITEEGLAFKAKAEMEKKMSYPMFGIGVQYMLNKKTDDPMLSMGNMNGKDMVMPMVSISLPLYRSKYRAQQRESKYWRQASTEKYTDIRNTLEAELYQTKHQLNNASRKIALYKKQSDLAKSTYNLVIKEFVSGRSDLTNVIQVQRQLLEYKLKESEAIADYNTMVASIQKLISFTDTEEEIKKYNYANK